MISFVFKSFFTSLLLLACEMSEKCCKAREKEGGGGDGSERERSEGRRGVPARSSHAGGHVDVARGAQTAAKQHSQERGSCLEALLSTHHAVAHGRRQHLALVGNEFETVGVRGRLHADEKVPNSCR